MRGSIVPDRIGQVVGQRYQIAECVGEGGQSTVYRARDLRAGDEVALKILKPEHAGDSDSRERMLREARAMATLQGTAALRVYDQQWTSDACLCLVTEFLHGLDLDDYLKHLERGGGRMDPRTLAVLLDPVIYTLQAAHQQGIIHRDLKPGNIFVLSTEAGGGVRLLDFGFAKFTRLMGLTAEHMVAGSPSYIAPESWRGVQDIDQRLDVYAMGAVLFRCLAGRPPFTQKDLLDLLKAVTRDPRPSLHALRTDLPGEIDDWVRQALAIEREDRFLRIDGMWRAFRGILGV